MTVGASVRPLDRVRFPATLAPMLRHVLSFLLLLGIFVGASATDPASPAATSAGLRVAASASVATWVQERIIGTLRRECYACHSVEQRKSYGGLRVDSLEAFLAGGHDVPNVLVPWEPKRSMLMPSLRWEGDSDLNMPPNRKLDPAVIADFEHWIRIGAPWPDAAAAVTAGASAPARPPWLGMAHPAMVHLPIGALIVAVFLELLAIRWMALRPAVTVTLAVTVLGCAAAIISGLWWEGSVQAPKSQIDNHELAGWATAVVSVLALIFSRRTQEPGRSRILATLLVFAACAVGGLTGHMGGEMVHQFPWPW